MNLNLQNKNALVCGSTQGIGKASAIELALLGANVTLLARNEESLRTALKDLDTTKGQQHGYLCADFTDQQQLKAAVNGAVAKEGVFHILVNNTGGPAGGPITEAKPEEFINTFNNHLICNHLLMQAVLPGMKIAGFGRIINIISTSVKQPIPGLGVSNTIRASVGNWSKTLAGEVAQYGITVNNVLPGATNTVRLQSIMDNKAQKTGKKFDEIQHEFATEVPMKRIAEAHEVAAAVAFLASPAASYITGINVPVDGGRTMCL